MKKDFEKWHDKKERIHAIEERPFFHTREVWWCSLGANVGYEEDGKNEKFARPVLVFKKFNNEIFWAIPLTLQVKKTEANMKFYSVIHLSDDIERLAILSQLRLIDAKRLIVKIDFISKKNYSEVQKTIIRLCGG
jgi:hypothetical protein